MPGSRVPNPTTPEAFPIPPPQPPVDLSFFLGALNADVKTLKERSDQHETKLNTISSELAGAKTALKLLRWFVGAIGSVLLALWVAYLEHIFSVHVK